MTLAQIINKELSKARLDKEKKEKIDALNLEQRKQRLQKWLNETDNLFEKIKKMLTDNGLSPDAIRFNDIEIEEEIYGKYKIPALEAEIGNNILFFQPIGTSIISALGRIDITSNIRGAQTIKLIADIEQKTTKRSEKNILSMDWKWYVYPGRGTEGGYPFDEEGFSKILTIFFGEK
jgi:hypothetical protein